MSAFDSTVNVIGTAIGAPSEEQLKAGAPSAMEVELTIGMGLPFSQGPGYPPVVAPIGRIRFALDQSAAMEFFTKGLEEAKKLPVKPQIDIATSLDGVDKVAQNLKAVTGQ